MKVLLKMDKNFIQSKRKYKNETEDEFIERCRKQIDQRFFYFHYKGEGWCWDTPSFDDKGFFVGNPIRGLLEEEVA